MVGCRETAIDSEEAMRRRAQEHLLVLSSHSEDRKDNKDDCIYVT